MDTQVIKKTNNHRYIDQSLNWNQILDSSVILMKKAISSYNNLLNNEKIEDFITYFHISINRLIVAYFKKIGKSESLFSEKGKIKGFQAIINLLSNEKFFEKNELDYFINLNDLRNAFFHYDISKSTLTTSFRWYTFFNGLIILWEKLKKLIDNEILNENILVLTTYDFLKKEIEEDTFYLNKLKELEQNPVYQNAKVLTMKLYNLSKDNFKLNPQEVMNNLMKNSFSFTRLSNILKEKIIDANILNYLNKIFSINSNSWLSEKDKEKSIINEKYVFIVGPNFRYTKEYLDKLINICNGNKENYKDFFIFCWKNKKHLDIESFKWSSPETKSIINEINKTLT